MRSAAAIVACVLLGTGCTGRIGALGNQDELPPGFGGAPGAAGVPGSGVIAGSEVGESKRAANPDLFATSMSYFPGAAAGLSKKRLFRLSRTQLDTTARALLPAHQKVSAVTTLPGDPLQTNYEYSDNLGFNAANFTPFTNWVSAMVESVRADPHSVIDCSASGDTPDCLAAEAKKFVQRAFRGVVSDAQLERHATFFANSVAAVGLPNAVADLVDVTLTSPSFAFRSEVTTDAGGLLSPAELLQAIAYTLSDAPPEALGLSSADAFARVQSVDGVRQTVDLVLSTPDARQKLLRFFSAWLEVKAPEEFGISTSVFPEFTPEVAAAVVADTNAFLERQLSATAPTLKVLTESSEAVVSNQASFLYGIGPSAPGATVNVDPAQRVGLFTQPAVIASHSGPTTTRLVKRGVFFTRKVMCLPLGNPPPDVNTTVPMTPGVTERQKIESMTNQPRCLACHGYINPFGFMQENYDAIGRFRTTDQGLPIDPSVAIDFLEEGKLQTASPVEALRAITRSLRFQQCFARQLFRFYMGRQEAAGDDPLLRLMFFDFADGGKQDLLGMLRTLVASPEFAHRLEAP